MVVIPALICLGALVAARLIHSRRQDLESPAEQIGEIGHLTRPYWIYLGGGALIAAGMADFALIGFHFQKTHQISANLIPVFYSVAEATNCPTANLFWGFFHKFRAKYPFLAVL